MTEEMPTVSPFTVPKEPSQYVMLQTNPYPQVRDIEAEAIAEYWRTKFTWKKWWKLTLDHLRHNKHVHRRWLDNINHFHFRYDKQ